MEEIIIVAINCFVLTLIGLAIGFGLLRLQGK